MKKIYLKDKDGNKVTVEVSDEISVEYRQSLRAEWRNNAYEKYHKNSLDEMLKAGRDFKDEQADVEEIFVMQEEKKERALQIKKLKTVLPYLTELQMQTIHKLFYLNMSQAEIAREESVSEQAVSDRVERLFKKLKKLMKKD